MGKFSGELRDEEKILLRPMNTFSPLFFLLP